MKSDSQLMNTLVQNNTLLYQLSEQESVKLKKSLLSIYLDLKNLCNKHNLTVMFAGGSCLGAIRHKGFIPWDDDLDLMMHRDDYNKLLFLIKSGNLSDKYEFTYPNPEYDSKNLFLKIYLKGTINLELHNEGSPFPKGISIDIFPLDVAPRNLLKRYIKGFIADSLQFVSISTLLYQYPSNSLKKFMYLNMQTLLRYKVKITIGFVFSFISHKRWAWWYDSFVTSDEKSEYLCIPTGRKYYLGEVFNKSIYFPTTKSTFEGIEVEVPNNVDVYLKNLYSNYMQLPPINKRERHFVIKFDSGSI